MNESDLMGSTVCGAEACRRLALLLNLLLVAGLACSAQVNGAEPDGSPDSLATSVAATLTALPTTEVPLPTSTEAPTSAPTPTESPSPTPEPTATDPPPPDGVSLNCDGTYQRVRLEDAGAAGRSLYIDNWIGSGWENVWAFDAGDPMIRQLSEKAGARSFGGCRQLVLLPLRYAGSGAVLELQVLGWTGDGVVELYQNDGVHGAWQQNGDQLLFEESLYLFGEPNCCPCNRQFSTHRWNGSAFVEVSTEIEPTYSGTPPPICIAR